MRKFGLLFVLFFSLSTLVASPAQAADYSGSGSGVSRCLGGGFIEITNDELTGSVECEGAVVIPNGVTSLSPNAFAGSDSLTEVTVPTSTSSIPSGVFEGITSLTAINVIEPNSDFSSDLGVLFNDDKSILLTYPAGREVADYIVPVSVTTIAAYSFTNSTNLESIRIPGSVKVIEDSAFNHATSIERVVFVENGLTTIGDTAFYRATSLTNLSIPSSVTSIGSYAFSGAGSLTDITIPTNVSFIGEGAFENLSSLIGINVSELNPNFTSYMGVLFNDDKSNLIAFPAGKEATEFLIPSSVTTISKGAFFGANSLSRVVIPDNVTEISDGAFSGATSLSSIVIPSTVTTIGSYSFANTTALQSITIPENVTLIGDNAFDSATSLANIFFQGPAPQSIGSGAFANVNEQALAITSSNDLSYPSLGELWNGLTIANVFAVTYVSNSETEIPVGSYISSRQIQSAPTPSARSGLTFIGWSATEGGSVLQFPYRPNTPATVTLYANWVETAKLRAAADLAARTIATKKSYVAKTLGKKVGLRIVSSKATVSIKVSSSSKKICTKSGSKLKTLKPGKCVVTFTVQEPKPKSGKKPKATKTVKTLVVK